MSAMPLDKIFKVAKIYACPMSDLKKGVLPPLQDHVLILMLRVERKMQTQKSKYVLGGRL